MASSQGAVRRTTRVVPPILLAGLAVTAYKVDMRKLSGSLRASLLSFATGPGYRSRLLALFVVLWNWKSLPFAWTFRVWYGMISHLLVRKFNAYGPEKLFSPVVVASHVTAMEVDYNVHKSNSTYFADLDVSRTHLVSHLYAEGCGKLANNHIHRLVLDPDPTKVDAKGERLLAKGRFNVMLGGVHCGFKREITPYARYEMWSRLLGWDRKWMYMVTHFVEKGTADKMRRADAKLHRAGKSSSSSSSENGNGNGNGFAAGILDERRLDDKKVYATAVSKYVMKMGRLTVHPANLFEHSGMLPPRPGGWYGEDSVEPPSAASLLPEADVPSSDSEWDWRRVERERLRGLEFVRSFAGLDALHSSFPEGELAVPAGEFAPG